MGDFLILFIVLAIGALVSLYFLIINYKKFQLISKTETSTISFLQEGFCEIKGKIVSIGGEMLNSPFSEKPCVYYQFKVEQKKSSGKHSHYVTIIDDRKFRKFGVDDSSGVAIIDLQNADIQIKIDKKDSSGFFDRADQQQINVLNKYNQTSKGFLFEKTLKYTEKFLEVGDEVYILGEMQGKEGSKPLIRKGNLPLFVSDKSEHELLNFYRLRIILSSVIIVGVAVVSYFIINN